MAKSVNQETVALNALLISSLAMTDTLAKLLIEKGIISQQEITDKLSEERAGYHKLLNRRGIERISDEKT
jgi:hypothetical protein